MSRAPMKLPCEVDVHEDLKRIADASGKKLYAVVRDARDALVEQQQQDEQDLKARERRMRRN